MHTSGQQKRSNDAGTTGRINDYQYGAEVSLQFPRFLNPFKTPPRILRERLRKREAAAIAAGKPLTLKPQRTYFESPMTTLSASTNVIKRALYFKRHVVAGELTYSWAPSERHSFIFKPLSLTYEYMRSVTDRFKALTDSVPYLEVSMADQFIPKALFQYTYQSPSGYANPIRWWSTVSEASNVIALGYLASGQKWNKREKTMFKNPFAQFVKIETNFTKLWALSGKSSIAAHANAGVVWAYGNSRFAPYSEQFFVGGANSIRAFNVPRNWSGNLPFCIARTVVCRANWRGKGTSKCGISSAFGRKFVWCTIPRCWQCVDFAQRCQQTGFAIPL